VPCCKPFLPEEKAASLQLTTPPVEGVAIQLRIRPAYTDSATLMPITSMSQMWTRLNTYTIAANGEQRSVNHNNEWGGLLSVLEDASLYRLA
jgi:hypothetical protein